MNCIRRFAFAVSLITACTAAYATCADIRKNCQREFDLDNAYCNKQPPQSQNNCFARSHERFLSCFNSCK